MVVGVVVVVVVVVDGMVWKGEGHDEW